METQDAGNFQAGGSDASQALHDLDSIGDEGGQAAGSARLTMSRDDALHANRCRLVVEKHPTASVHLHVDQSGCKDHIGGKLDSCALSRGPEADVLDPPLRNTNRPAATHVMAVENALSGNRERGRVSHQCSPACTIANC